MLFYSVSSHKASDGGHALIMTFTQDLSFLGAIAHPISTVPEQTLASTNLKSPTE